MPGPATFWALRRGGGGSGFSGLVRAGCAELVPAGDCGERRRLVRFDAPLDAVGRAGPGAFAANCGLRPLHGPRLADLVESRRANESILVWKGFVWIVSAWIRVAA